MSLSAQQFESCDLLNTMHVTTSMLEFCCKHILFFKLEITFGATTKFLALTILLQAICFVLHVTGLRDHAGYSSFVNDSHKIVVTKTNNFLFIF